MKTMEPTWIFKKNNNNYTPFSPDNKSMLNPMTKIEVEQAILRRGSLVELDLARVPKVNIDVYIDDGMVKYSMIQTLSESLTKAMGANKVVGGKLKIVYTVDGIANPLKYDIVLYQDEYFGKLEAEIVRAVWGSIIKEIINSIRGMYPSTSVSVENLCHLLGIELGEERVGADA